MLEKMIGGPFCIYMCTLHFLHVKLCDISGYEMNIPPLENDVQISFAYYFI
jgi:hypothetical protein